MQQKTPMDCHMYKKCETLGYQSRQSPKMRYIKVCRDVSLQTGNVSWQWELVWSNFLTLRCEQEVVVAIASRHSGCHNSQYVRGNWVLWRGSCLRDILGKHLTYLVVSHVIVGAQPLDLHGTQHPADIVNDVNIRRTGLLMIVSIE